MLPLSGYGPPAQPPALDWSPVQRSRAYPGTAPPRAGRPHRHDPAQKAGSAQWLPSMPRHRAHKHRSMSPASCSASTAPAQHNRWTAARKSHFYWCGRRQSKSSSTKVPPTGQGGWCAGTDRDGSIPPDAHW